jgi:hypothetical protein
MADSADKRIVRGSDVDKALERRDFPRLKAAFTVRFGVCGAHGREVPGFTNNVSVGGLSFLSPGTTAKVGDHLAVEIAVPGFEQPLYFLGEVMRLNETPAGTEVACRFDWLGKSDSYKEKLLALIEAHRDQ